MDARRRVLIADGGIGVVSVWAGVFYGGAAVVDRWWIGALVALVTVGFAWAEEHGVVGYRATVALVAAFGGAMLVLGGLGRTGLVGDLVPAALVGIGFGTLAYRAYFGLVKPIPEARLERAGGGVA